MKQSMEEAAYNYATEKTEFRKDVLKEVDADNFIVRHSDCTKDFICGAEWQAEQSPWISVKDEFPPHSKEVLLLNNRDKIIGYQTFNEEYDIKMYCDWYCISHWALANFPEQPSKTN